MKLLPDCSLLTKEDLDIWVCRKWDRYTFKIADGRDAALMLALREARVLCDGQDVLHCILAGYETALQGYDDESKSLVELGLAMRIPKLPRRYR